MPGDELRPDGWVSFINDKLEKGNMAYEMKPNVRDFLKTFLQLTFNLLFLYEKKTYLQKQ